jgi:hypothetical protein
LPLHKYINKKKRLQLLFKRTVEAIKQEIVFFKYKYLHFFNTNEKQQEPLDVTIHHNKKKKE